MKIEIWSDYMCPFCYIGKKRLETALQQFEHRDQVELTYRSFELDPHAPRDLNQRVVEMLAAKYSMSIEQASAMQNQVAAQASTVGLTFNFDKMINTNTRDAHRLTRYASDKGKGAQMTERLFFAAFTESQHVGNRDVLTDLAVEIGLDRVEVTQLWESDAYVQEVLAEEQRAQAMGVRGVPYFLVDGKLAVTGAQSSEHFTEALQYAWQHREQSEEVSTNEDAAGSGCVDGTCSV
ncbi:DsbA family oxidoreductase [Paenibacillus sp. SC116]|uniref:DsbA family oxidoreductase n=1 Tax=Paenibacillus sp. SC116 TaxID=2968986 RepID=UPI00215A2634|nr:DsbA family oxidoreductase [Paenibacillus sp. SC116]MCR8845602.1 DsbA family oxidoreductase [Paenibacillus sp. SC116]